MFNADDIVVNAGDIQIESISGFLRDDSFILYFNTVEKYADVDSDDDNYVYVSVGEDTRRHGQRVEASKGSTEIRFPPNWIAHAFPGRHCFQVIGVRRSSSSEKESYNIPFLQVG